MTATRFSVTSSSCLNTICMRKLPPMSTGIRTRLIRNARVRTAARYSRAAMTSTLRMLALLAFRTGDAHEDVVQRRPRQLEMPHRAALHQRRQQLLRIGAAIEAQFL